MEFKKTALLILHWQNDVAHPKGKLTNPESRIFKKNGAIENAAKVLDAARKKDMMIIYVSGAHRVGYPEMSNNAAPMSVGLKKTGAFLKGQWGAEVIDQLTPQENEILIVNSSTSAFIYTELDPMLRNHGIDHVVLSGMSTDWVIESSARDAFNRGYFVTTLSDCCDSPNLDAHEFFLKNTLPMMGSVIDSASFIQTLSA